MQVANLFRDNVILLGATSTMNSSSESALTSLEEEEEDTTKIDTHNVTSNLPLSVSSLVSLASTALLENDSSKTINIDKNVNERNSSEEEKERENAHLLNDGTFTCDNENVTPPGEEEDGKKHQSDNTSACPYDGPSVSISPSLPQSKGNLCESEERSSYSPLKTSLSETEDKTYKLDFGNCEANSHALPSQATSLILANDESAYKKTFVRPEQNVPESSQTENNDISSSITLSNHGESLGCANSNISDVVELEAENLVIHQHDHSNSAPRKTSSNDNEMLRTKKQRCDEKQRMDTDETLEQHAHKQQMEFESQQMNQQPEDQNEIVDGCSKHNQYSQAHQFHECLRSDLTVQELSEQNINEQQISQNSLGPNVEDYNKMQHLPSNMNMISQIDHQHQYQHLNQNQHLHQHSHQLYLQHHDQEHMIHQQQQHSELMAYLHHQDQQALQQPHHIRTYQHYQQQQQRIHQLPQPQSSSPHLQQKHSSITCIDDLMIDEFHEDPNTRYKLLSPTVKHESQDDGYETSAGDVLTPNSHSSSHSMTPQHQIHSTNLVPPKCEDMSATQHTDPDPYNFIDDEINSNMRLMSPSSNNDVSMVLRPQNYGSPPEATGLLIEDRQNSIRMGNQQIIDTSNTLRMQVSNADISGDVTIPKKRGRKKKCAEDISTRTMVDGILKPILQKERKKHDRFNGMPEEEVSKRTLPDHLADNLDIIIIGINPGLFAAYKGHHYAGPGNHFWKCLYLSGLTHEQMTAEEDYKLLKFGIGFTNMVERATKGSADLTRKEIKEGSRILLEKLKRFRPKIAVFNGKLIFEVFSGKKDFNFGRQQECVEGTDTFMWVMPSSSARCAQLPRAADKVPFYAALKKFRDYLNGLIPHMDELECVFNDPKSKQCCESDSKEESSPVNGPFMTPDCLNSENQNLGYNNSNSSTPERGSMTDLSTNLKNNNNMNLMHKVSPVHSIISSGDNSGTCGMILSTINGSNPMNLCNSVMHIPCNLEQSGQPEKKKRGRPKKIKGIDGEDGPIPQKVRNTNSLINNNNNILNLTVMSDNGEIPKKKRGRPKKIKTEIGTSSSLVSNISSNNGNNTGRVPASIPMDNSSVGTAKTTCLRNSPSCLGNHQIHAMNNNNQFNSQTLSQQQPLQNQRLFSSPMHSPNTVSSYCPMGMNASTTPPTGNTNSNNSNLGNSGAYHQQHLGNSHHLQSHQHNHLLQRVQHQLHIAPVMYMPSSNHNTQQSSKSPHYGSSHSDLSTEISAAISSEHLVETQSESSPAMGNVDYDRPDSIPNEEHDLRFASPTSNSGDPQQSSGPTHQIQHYHSIYQNQSSNHTYLSTNSNSVLGSAPGESGGTNGNGDSINYIVTNRSHTSNSNASTPQPAQIQNQQRNLQISDVTSKSLSGLESLVDQIPTMAENETTNPAPASSVECRIKSDSNEGFTSTASGGKGAVSSNSSGIGCIYIPSYSNLNSSSSSSPSSAAPSNSSILSPHHYPDPIYSTANTCPSSTNANSNNNINYNGLASNFSVSSLTSNNYPTNAYHSNLMTAASSPHHITPTASGSPMYMDPHMPVAVSPIYHHPYAQHAGYAAYSPVGPPPPPPPTLHMPSPNYPYSYTNTSGYPSQASHHPSHTSAAGYLTNHPSMFDRIKPDIGYGGY